MLTPEQSRAARGWLDWSQDDLAKRANVSLSTVRDFEKGRRVPIGNNLQALRNALEAGGVRPIMDATGKPLGITIGDTQGIISVKSKALGRRRGSAADV